MASVASQLIEEVTAHAQSDSLEDAREICEDGNCFPNNICTLVSKLVLTTAEHQKVNQMIFKCITDKKMIHCFSSGMMCVFGADKRTVSTLLSLS